MAISTIKASLDDIAQNIRTERQALTNAKARMADAVGNLNAMPTTFLDAITEIQGYGTDDPFEALSKDELTKLTVEFQALVSEASAAVTALENITEF